MRAALLLAVVTAAGAVGAVGVSAAEAPPYDELPIFLSAEEAVPEDLRVDDYYRIWDRVENDGYLNRYIVDSDFGVFEASSTANLRSLKGEIHALAQLEEVSRAEAFADAVTNTVKSPIDTARVIADEPVETLKRVPGGVGRYFKRTARRVRNLAEDVQEEYREYKDDKAEKEAAEQAAAEAEVEAAEASGTEPTEDGESPSGEADTGEEGAGEDEWSDEEGEEGEETLADEARDEASRYATRKLGYRRERRRLAGELGVDPYSDNEVLNRELNRVAQAAAVGGLAVKFSGFGLPFFVYDAREVASLVWNLRPLDLRLRNEKLLKEELGLTREPIDALYDNRQLTATLITALVEALVDLDSVGGRELFVELATAADSRDLAHFTVRIAGYFASVHQAGTRVDHFEATPLVPIAQMVDGSRVVALAVDHLAWTEEIDALLDERGVAAAADVWPSPLRRVVLEGTASKATRSALQQRGWELDERGFPRVEEPSPADS